MNDAQAPASRGTRRPAGAVPPMPVLATAVKDARTSRKLLFTLRHFHLGDPGASEKLEAVGDDVLPALLSPFRDTSRLRYDYPLFLFPADSDSDGGGQDAAELACPLAEWLQRATDGMESAEGAATILRDQLPWLDHHLRLALAQTEGPVDAIPSLTAAGEALKERLQLDPAGRERLAADLARLIAQVPEGASILAYGRYPALHLMVHAIRSQVIPRRARFAALIGNCLRGLEALLQVEWVKSDEAIEPAMARDSVGPGGNLFDVAALSEVMDHSRGTRKMPAERRARIQRALEVLMRWEDDPVLVRFVHDGSLSCDWAQDDTVLNDVVDADPCERATALFDEQAGRLAEVFAAVRIAQLEINGIYDPAIHDPWFANFSWEGFSQNELLLVPTVIAVGGADWMAGDGLRSFSRLLSSGRPVQILVRVQPSNNPGTGPDEEAFHRFRVELGYLAISHRQAFVAQSSAARHQHLLDCFLAALEATRTSLHLINTGMRTPSTLVPLNAWLVAGAALEGRAHPFFRVNPEAGDYAAARMSFADNPQPERDWPRHPFEYVDDDGNRVEHELAFTFADYALLIERLRDHFRLIPPGCDSDALVPMQDYLSMKPDEAYQRVPFVWGVDAGSQLHRLVVSRQLALAALDRLNFWHTLQELAGVRNRYVELAIERTRAEERERAAEERERLTAEHAAELEHVRGEAAGEAMHRLTDLLLGIDFGAAGGAPLPAGRQPAAAVPASEPAPETGSPETVTDGPEPEAESSFDNPWVDTPLCTSCNDCLKINPLLFVYNEDKQALLGDLGKASYAQLVEAAELCPARCIHPGRPWNPEEPDLEALIERAAPFNQ